MTAVLASIAGEAASTTVGSSCGRAGATAVLTGKAKTKEDRSPVKTPLFIVLASNSLQNRLCLTYRLFHPTFNPRHRLQNAKDCIGTSRMMCQREERTVV